MALLHGSREGKRARVRGCPRMLVGGGWLARSTDPAYARRMTTTDASPALGAAADRPSRRRLRGTVIALLVVGAGVALYLALRDPWDARGVAELVALRGGHAVLVESTYSNSKWDRELTLTRVDAAGNAVWRTQLMTGGGNIGDVLTQDATPSVLVLRRDPRESEEEGPWLTGVSSETGAVLWDLRMAGESLLSANVVSDGHDLWIVQGSDVEWRASATGAIRWKGQLRISWRGGLVASQGILAADGRVDRAGAFHPSPGNGHSLSGLCVISERAVSIPSMSPANGLGRPTELELTQRAVDGATEVLKLPLSTPEADALSLEINGSLCGRAPTVDVVAFDVLARSGNSRTRVWGFDPTRREVAWTLDFGEDSFAFDIPSLRRARGAGRLARYVGVVIEVGGARPAETDAVRVSDYRLDVIDLERGRIAWRLPLAQHARLSFPHVVATESHQFIADAEPLDRLIVLDVRTGELVKAIAPGRVNAFVQARQITDDTIWLRSADGRTAYGYTLPDLVSPNPAAPAVRDITADVRASIQRSP